VFVSGSFDKSGGQAMGARLFVDNLVVDATPPPPNVDVTVLNKIATKLTLATGNDLVSTNNPEITQISVEAVTIDGQYQTSEVFDLNTDDLVELGAVVDKGIYRSEIIGRSIPAFSGSGDVIAAGEILLNGIALGPLTVGLSGVDGYGRLSALDVKSWLDSAALPEVNVKVWNRVFVPEDSVQLTGAGIKINGTRIVSAATGVSTSFDSLSDMVSSINAQTGTTGVQASLGDNGFLQLASDGGNIELAAATDAVSNNQLGVSNGVFVGEYRIREDSGSDRPISLELIGTGTPSDLNAIGLNTTVTVTGSIDEKIGVFIQGSNGSAASTLDTQLVSSGVGFVDGIRDRVYELDFINANTYRITDSQTDTVLAERAYDGETLISYQGIQIYLDRSAQAGDRFTIDGNNTGEGQSFDAQGNNSNILRVVALENQPVIGGKSLAESYLDFIGDVGNQAVQAEISQDALAVLRDQAIEARDRVSGVNLDQEAADLIKFQQAYQASAQILQVATRLFDAMLQIR
jgi:flagellar hook-associated protein FlgK